jgi:DNA-binding transcriptional ArsR family regulator
MLRIHFTTADLAQTRVAPQPDPLWEIALSMHVLRSRDTDPLLEGWKLSSTELIRSTDGLMPKLAIPFILNPPIGYFPDFLTPAAGRNGIDAGLQAILATPTRQLKAEIAMLCDSNPAVTSTIDDIARGHPQALTHLGAALRKYHDTMLAPHWTHISAAVEADRALRGRQMLDEGPAAVLDGLAPRARFRGNALELLHFRRSRDVFLDGRGVTLVPSYFKETSTLMVLANPSLAPVIVYPVHPDARITIDGRRLALDALIGRSRAAVLEQAAAGANVSDIARRLEISQPNASKHLAVLRAAGLLIAVRERNTTRHVLTPTGHTLLNGN